MHRDPDRQKLFTRRAIVVAGGKMVLLSALVGRMYYLQVVEAKRYATLADENRINLRLLPPPRGRIVDRYGVPVAVNRQNYRVLLISERAKQRNNDVQATLRALGTIVPISEAELERILREIRRRRGFVPVTVRENLNWDEVARIEVNAPDLPGVMIDVGQSRYYPYGKELAHILGYVGAVSENEATGDPLLELPGFRVGKSGIEKVYDLKLRGTGGTSQVEVNAVGRVIRELSRREGQPGAEVRLTIDLELQKMVSRRLEEESAAVVVIDVHTGAILALASSPSFDPNAFNKGLTQKDWDALVHNPRAPLTDKVIAGKYAPGSTFKPVVALAALDKGAITPATTFFCSGSIKLGNATFHCWKKWGHGTVDLAKGITESCDVYFYEVARRTGIDRIAAMARRLGLGQELGVDLPGEQAGLMPTRDWKRAVIGTPWQMGETLIAGIGQGYILVTPLQLAVMTARIVNGGFAVSPHVTEPPPGPRPASATPFESLGLSPEHVRIVRRAMAAVVNSRKGTAFRSRIKEPGWAMGGKTGTVQVRRITKAERQQGLRKNEARPWEERDHALFIGYAPVDNPRFAVAVVVEHGGGGSKAAAPIARDVLTEAQRREALKPLQQVRVKPVHRSAPDAAGRV